MSDVEALPDGMYAETFEVTASDIDVLQHVNNRVYLRWIEAVATNHSAQKGYDATKYLAMGSVWVAREHWIEYLRPCVLGDKVTVYTWVEAIAESRCLRRYAMTRGGKLVCNAATEWDFISFATKRRTAVPEALVAAFRLVAADDACLKALGISRPLRYAPDFAARAA